MIPEQIEIHLIELIRIDTQLDALPIPDDNSDWVKNTDQVAFDPLTYLRNKDIARRHLSNMANCLMSSLPPVSESVYHSLNSLRNQVYPHADRHLLPKE